MYALSEATVFSTLYVTSEYYQILIKETDQEKTAFTCKRKTYMFVIMLFGFFNDTFTFQRAMNRILKNELW